MRQIARPFVPLTLAAAVLLTACGGLGSSGEPIGHPTGDALILRVSYSGGLAGPGWDLLGSPGFSLLGDGRVMVPGAQIAIFPGPALPAVNVRRLSEAGIQAVLADLAGTGLFTTNVEFGGAQNCVMDASDAIFALHADNRDVTVKIYGLGTLDGGGGCPGVSATELAAHATLTRLQDRLQNFDAWLPSGSWANEWQAYHPEAMRLIVRNADADEPDRSGTPSGLVAWPASSDPATFGADTEFGLSCGVVTGNEANEWYDLLGQANQLTLFTRGDHRYAVSVRFLLPDEPPECVASAG